MSRFFLYSAFSLTLLLSLGCGELGDPENSFIDQVQVMQITLNQEQAIINLTITDAEGQPVTGLGVEEISLLEPSGAKLKSITALNMSSSFVGSSKRIALATSVDMSGSIGADTRRKIGSTLESFYKHLAGPFLAELIHFAERAAVTQSFTDDIDALAEAAVSEPDLGGSTAFFDGIMLAIQETEKQQADYRAVMVISDALDNSSKSDEEAVLAAANAASLPIFSIGVGRADIKLVRRLGNRSDGFYAYTPEVDDLPTIVAQMTNILENTYQIAIDGVSSGQVLKLAVDLKGERREVSAEIP